MDDADVAQPDDIRTKGKDMVQPRLETFKEQLNPLRIWVSKCSTILQYLLLSLSNEW